MTNNCSWNYHENYKRRTWIKHGLPIFCPWACSFHGNSMNSLLSYCGLIDAKIRASDKDLPVQRFETFSLSGYDNFNALTNSALVIAVIFSKNAYCGVNPEQRDKLR